MPPLTDIRRTLLWVVFTMSLVLLWDAWNKHNGQPTLFGAKLPASAAAAGAGASAGAVPGAAGVPSAAGAAAVAGALPGAGPSAAALAAEQVTVSTDLFKATFSSVGGTLIRLELLAFNDTAVNAKGKVVLFNTSAKQIYQAQTGMVSGPGASEQGRDLPTHLTPMSIVAGPRELAAGSDSLTIKFESQPVQGRVLRKSYTFKRGQYAVAVQHELVNNGAVAVQPQLYLQLNRDGAPPEGESSMYFTFTGPALYTEANKFHKVEFKDIAKGNASHDKSAKEGWVSMVQHYFFSAWLVPPGAQRDFRTSKVNAPGQPESYTISMVLPLGEVAAGASKTFDSVLYAGPQEENKLAAMGDAPPGPNLASGLELVKDYGYVHILAKPLFWLLDKLHTLLGNWGWAIVALVLLLKIAFYGLNASAYKSMAKMKVLAPKVTELRERYKGEPQKMQQEMMRIYREEKVNPLGGCLPIVAQMPFFIALYWVLLSSVEMRGAPWIGWIQDLAAPDSLFGVIPGLNLPVGPLPILMTASSLFQVWLNPTPPDPMQARMMWIMPLAFGVMFFFFPAGLVLYWLVNNILSIAQQWFINKKLGALK